MQEKYETHVRTFCTVYNFITEKTQIIIDSTAIHRNTARTVIFIMKLEKLFGHFLF